MKKLKTLDNLSPDSSSKQHRFHQNAGVDRYPLNRLLENQHQINFPWKNRKNLLQSPHSRLTKKPLRETL